MCVSKSYLLEDFSNDALLLVLVGHALVELHEARLAEVVDYQDALNHRCDEMEQSDSCLIVEVTAGSAVTVLACYPLEPQSSHMDTIYRYNSNTIILSKIVDTVVSVYIKW